MNLNNSPRAIHEYELQPERLFKFKFMNYALIMMSLELYKLYNTSVFLSGARRS